MADTSLNQYLTRIDTLLGEGLYDQAAFHSRTILQQLPKNIAAYRRLGQALLLDKRWEDAGEVLRRVLSVAPDDAFAHRGLSEVYRHTDQPLEAIWHLERAQEQDTNNPEILKGLRQLYRDYRGVDQPRLQLTVGAVARQYARNGLYDQSADALRRALQQQPDRIDLRLLLARVLRESGDQVEAARVAIDVLETLPDCAEANTILIELWLDQQRPSDAQRYLSRLEAVDPYLALELARGAPPDDDVIEVQEADYQAEARRRLASSTPDWLSQIDQEPESSAAYADDAFDDIMDDSAPVPRLPDDADLLETTSGDTVVAEPEPASDWYGSPASGTGELDWLDDVADASATADDRTSALDPFRASQPVPPPTPRKRGLTGLLASLDDDSKDETPDDEPRRILNTADLFADFPDDEPAAVADTDADAIIEASTEDVVSSGQHDAEDTGEDPLAWLRDSGVEMVENAESVRRRRTAEFDDPAGELSDPEAEDPLAWLHQSGVEILDDESDAQVDIDEDEDPLAWLHQSGVEITGDDSQVEDAVYRDVAAESDPAEDDGADPLDWLADDALLDELLDIESLVSADESDVEPDADQVQAEEADTDVTTGITAGVATTLFDEPLQEDSHFNPTGEEDRQDIMPDKNDTEFPDWLTEPEDDDEQENAGAESASEPEEFSLDWLTGGHDEETQQASPDSEPFDWPQSSASSDDDEEDDDAQPETPGFGEPGLFGDTEDGLKWGDSDEPFAADSGSDTPDWLREVSASTDDEQDDEEEFSFDLGDDEDESEEEFAVAEDMPDWLADAAPAGISDAKDAEDIEEEFGFLDSAEDEDEEEFAVAAEEPDWLADLQPAAVSESSDDDDDEEAFSFDLGDDEDEDEEEFAVAEEEPDWLADLQPAAVSESSDDDDDEEAFSFDLGDDEDEDEEEFAVAAEEADWLAELEPAAASESSHDDDEDDDLTFDDDLADEAEEDEVPVWLADLEPKADEPAPWFAETQESASFDEADQDEEVAAVEEEAEHDLEDFSFATEESSDWPAGEQLAAAAYVSQAAGDDDEDEAEWSDEAYPLGEVADEDDEFDAQDTPEQEWYADAAAASLLEADHEFVPHEQGPAIDEPTEDWLVASGQAADSDFAAEAASAESDEEFAAFEHDEPFATSAEPLEFDEVGMFDDEDEETTPTPATNAPDWLNAMVPGLDVDYEAEEDAQVEEAFHELPSQPRAVDGAPSARSSGDFGWLSEIVDEEFNKPPENLPPTPPPAAAAAEPPPPPQPRFSFSRPPAWLRKLRGESAPPAPASTTTSDEPIGEDLPDWLEFDDDDDFEADAGRR